MPDEPAANPSHELHVIVLELAQLAAVIHGCGNLLTTRKTNPDPKRRRLGTLGPTVPDRLTD